MAGGRWFQDGAARYAYFETPLYLRQQLLNVSDVFSIAFSDGLRSAPNLAPGSSLGRLNTKMTFVIIFKVILMV